MSVCEQLWAWHVPSGCAAALGVLPHPQRRRLGAVVRIAQQVLERVEIQLAPELIDCTVSGRGDMRLNELTAAL